MKRYVFVPILAGALVVSCLIYQFLLPDYIRLGGYLVPVLITLSILLVTFIVERMISLQRAQGRHDTAAFTHNVKQLLHAQRVTDAIEICRRQGGCLANVVGAGLQRYQYLQHRGASREEMIDETKRAIEEANALETPLLERSLVALSTIASIATQVGLLGTTIGMIRSFRAMGHTGAPDAIQLAIGISEALINTAGGLFIAIAGIVAYNYFTNRVDSFNYTMDETTYEVIKMLERQKEHMHEAA